MSEPVDLSNCDREPIHIPGSIQPHAVMIVLEEPALKILQVTANVEELLGRKAEELCGQRLESVLKAEDLAYLREQILGKPLDAAPHYLPPLVAGDKGLGFEGLVHRHQGVLIMELERWPDHASQVHEEIYASLKHTLAHLQGTHGVVDFCQRAAEHVRRFTGFDRIMVYRFAEDDSGHVIAEARREDLESYLGWHYPASDIPKQARELFTRSQLRLNPDVRYRPVPLVPAVRPDTGAPLDMSYCVSRSMSPIHAEYLQNMGVDASMSISIVIGDKLWGLFACHHYSPRYVSHSARMACEFLAHMLSLQVGGKETEEQNEYAQMLLKRHRSLADALAKHAEFQTAVIDSEGSTFCGVNAGGSALLFNDVVHLRGKTPGEEVVRQLGDLLAEKIDAPVWSTHSLGEQFPEMAPHAKTAAGVLAARLSRQSPSYLFWFRPEETQMVSWAGDKHKPMENGPLGDRLTPRKSFALWQEEVLGRSDPWLTCEVDLARVLRQSILETEVRRAEQLVKLNAELDERNSQLDSFAYVASHDLKEPLRGINNFSNFLLEDCAEQLDEQGLAYIRTMLRLTARMETLLDSLLYYSRLSRAELHARQLDMNAAVADAMELLVARIQESGAQIEVKGPLPVVRGDADRLSEVFSNLISNAIKYNDKKPPQIEIGHRQGSPLEAPVFYVKDNGIGIAQEHQKVAFQIFKRLHGREAYGGGVGAGLTIVRRIIERHGGSIWIESAPGQGTIFYFTLASPEK
ncbi:MAG: ATP-binding protein [Prosthecobacter sp.]